MKGCKKGKPLKAPLVKGGGSLVKAGAAKEEAKIMGKAQGRFGFGGRMNSLK